MSETWQSIYTNQDIAPLINAVVKEAKEKLVLVTPYLKLWGHLKYELISAKQRGVNITFLIRQNPGKNEPPPERNPDVAWGIKQGFSVKMIENLHAKIYLNEKRIIVSSMNLTESSMQNSHEIALLVQVDHYEIIIREYVEKLLGHPEAKTISVSGVEQAASPFSKEQATKRGLPRHMRRY